VVSINLDTNIYVSGLEFNGIGSRLLGMARYGQVCLDISAAILDELMTVLRDDFAWDGYRMHDMREKLVGMSNFVVPAETLNVVPDDPDDNRILECAVEAGSDFLVTEDKDCCAWSPFGESES